MSDGPEWFAAKRCGFGSGVPIAWQGWLVLLFYLAVIFGSVFLFDGRLLIMGSIIVPATALVLIVSAKTTRGGWRWRCGNRG